ncbi:MAG: hypothetical protein U0326_25435 [Polyangiales bacterium]
MGKPENAPPRVDGSTRAKSVSGYTRPTRSALRSITPMSAPWPAPWWMKYTGSAGSSAPERATASSDSWIQPSRLCAAESEALMRTKSPCAGILP